MRNAILVLTTVFTALALSGCGNGIAGLDPMDVPRTVIKNPLGTDPIRVGMSKDVVRDKWGDPDQINMLEPTDEWGTPREEWVYLGRASKIPLDKSYIFKTKYIIFDGNNVVCVGDESQCDVGNKLVGVAESTSE
jgi:hypothetical protein